jgi:hypothetical protein
MENPNQTIVVKVKTHPPIFKFTRFLGLLHKIVLRSDSLRFARLRFGSIKLLKGIDFLLIYVSFLALFNSHEAFRPNCR